MRTQAEIDTLLDQLQAAYNGTKPDYWGYPGECLSYVKRWVDTLRNGHVGGAMAAPASNNGFGTGYFYTPPQVILELFDKQAYDPNARYPAGSLFTYGKSGHIGILLNNQQGNPTALVTQSNADPDGSAVHQVQRAKNRIDGILVLRVAAITPPAPAPTYQVIETYPQGKQIQLNKNTNLWGMNYREFQYMADHPIEAHAIGEIWTVTNKVQHVNGHHYYRRDGQVDGFNVADCNDYTPPPPPPYVPPAGSVRPVLVEYYDLKTTVTWFKAAADARKDENAKGTLDPGKYILLASDGMARELTKNNHDVETFWINDGDNKLPELPPVPEPVITQPVDIVVPVIEPVDPPAPALPKHQFQMINPVQLEAINAESQTFPDLEGKTKILVQLNPGKINEYTMRTIIDGEEWLVPTVSMKRGYRHAVPRDLLDYPQTEAKYNLFDRDKDGDVDIRDFSDGLQGFLDIVPKWYKTTVAPLAPKLTEVKTRLNKAVDGFSKRTKK